ncbi:MAG: hypothetical protein VR74_09410 [Hyphomonas sp. BRH_c22]|uniref:helix-turn-helix transcriptional regulator n=1 Tax=Hyphomonas sp. BRH_c22 TaxID=1629710 RepID=UPI0005F16EC9|nr:LuxR C-terminal-related transcriptional regulator [Hyphomonas sp. BRH_c22]KJS37267.1 MAG: hypothetical protein VR74_09410 [Hyphomonas sp. BRH_c22]
MAWAACISVCPGAIVSSNSPIYKFQNLLLEGISDPAALPFAMEYLTSFCDAPTAQIIFVGDGKNILQSTIVGTHDPELFRLESQYWPINPRAKLLPDMPVGVIWREQDFITPEEIARDQAYQEFLIPAKVGHFAGVVLERDHRSFAALAVAQPYEHGPISDSRTETLNLVVDAARPVLDIAARMFGSRNEAIVSAFGASARVAILRKDGTLLDRSKAFESLLSAGIVRIDRFGQLDLMSDDANRQLAMAVRPPNGIIGGRFALSRLRPEDGYICIITPVTKTNDSANRSGEAILFLEPIFQKRELDPGLLMEAFGFTEAECSIAERLFTGDNVKEIARFRHVAPSTVKTMLKSIMLKTESRRQAEVVTKLSRFAFPAKL